MAKYCSKRGVIADVRNKSVVSGPYICSFAIAIVTLGPVLAVCCTADVSVLVCTLSGGVPQPPKTTGLYYTFCNGPAEEKERYDSPPKYCKVSDRHMPGSVHSDAWIRLYVLCIFRVKKQYQHKNTKFQVK
jgi:hypothetical protein